MTTPRYLTDFKAALFDVDGTLTNTKSDKEFLPRTRRALQSLLKTDVIVGLATGRTMASLGEKYFPLFPPTAKHITAGGGQIVTSTCEVVWEQLLDEKIVEEIYTRANAENFPINLQQNGRMYVNDSMREYIEIHWDRYSHTLISPISELKSWRVANVILFSTPEFLAELQSDPRVQVKSFFDNVTHFDVTAPGVTKGTTLVKWAEMHNVQPSDIIVFGDSNNDLEMFQVAGYRVALGNAIPELKAIADRIIGHADNFGLAEYLEKIVKGAPL